MKNANYKIKTVLATLTFFAGIAAQASPCSFDNSKRATDELIANAARNGNYQVSEARFVQSQDNITEISQVIFSFKATQGNDSWVSLGVAHFDSTCSALDSQIQSTPSNR